MARQFKTEPKDVITNDGVEKKDTPFFYKIIQNTNGHIYL